MGWNGWCSRREGDGYAPDDHDGSYLHHREPNCLNFVTAATYPDLTPDERRAEREETQ